MPVCPECQEQGALGAECPSHPGFCFADALQIERHRDDGAIIGRLLGGRFGLVRVLGKGGMGWVFEAVDRAGTRLAVKVLRADHVDDEVVRSRFFREGDVLGMLEHPNLVRVYDYGTVETDGHEHLYLAMELLRGQTLMHALLRPRFFGAARILGAAHGVAGALAAAHEKGITHRDLKPENVLLVRDEGREVAKLVDFGIARLSSANTILTQTGAVFGTPSYMSPEQAVGSAEVGAPADVYAFGVMLYRAIAGKLPFDSRKPLQILMQHVNQPPPPLEPHEHLSPPPPQGLLDLTLRCLEKKPEDRPSDGSALVAELALIDPQGAGIDPGDAATGAHPSIAPEPAVTAAHAVIPVDEGAPTIVFGGDYELVDEPAEDDSPAGEATVNQLPSAGDSQARFAAEDRVDRAAATVTSLPSAADPPPDALFPEPPKDAYRMPSSGSPSQLRGPGTPSLPLVPVIGGVIVLIILVAVVVLASSGDDESGADHAASDSEAAESAGDSDESGETDGPGPAGDRGLDSAAEGAGTPAPEAAGATKPVEAAATSEAGAEPKEPTKAELEAQLEAVRKDLELALKTAISDEHRESIRADFAPQIEKLVAAVDAASD